MQTNLSEELANEVTKKQDTKLISNNRYVDHPDRYFVYIVYVILNIVVGLFMPSYTPIATLLIKVFLKGIRNNWWRYNSKCFLISHRKHRRLHFGLPVVQKIRNSASFSTFIADCLIWRFYQNWHRQILRDHSNITIHSGSRCLFYHQCTDAVLS